MRILGVHDGHNASACLLEDGQIKYCIQEERLTNQKNYFGFPVKSIKKVFALANIDAEELDFVAMSSFYVSMPHDILTGYKEQSTSYKTLMRKEQLLGLMKKTSLYPHIRNRIVVNRRKNERLKDLAKLGISEKRVVFVDHHLCHASAAYYGSPWKDEKVLVLTNDGSGDELCSTVYIGEDGNLNKIAETPAGNSIGNIYSRVTFMLGLIPWEHEWKIMGLAPYSPENGTEKSYNVFKKYLKIHDGALTFERSISEPTHLIYPRLRRELELHRFDWISGGLQKFTEELLCRWIRNAIKKTGIHKVALSGGVFMNVKANKRITEIKEVEDIFIFPSSGDESNSIGAAYWIYAEKCKELNKKVDIQPLREIYFGPSFTDNDVEEILSKIDNAKFSYEYVDDIENQIAEMVSEGKIVARCKGRMEFGARALGNRSILADASNYGCVRTINMMVKKRDFWMPFAPVIMKERESDYIINPKRICVPYMMLSFDTTERRGEFISSVHQADLTARPQVLEEDWNPMYYRILKEFEKETGNGVLLNTSFNLHGYPIVYSPKEALWVLENSGLLYLALGNYLIEK